ncbi:MAG: amidase [Alphaproteobacteria bacterium]|nr:amidase [Alphaproteobacteria bacterium]
MRNICEFSATEMAAKIRGGEVSSLEVVDAHLQQCADLDGGLHAFVHIDPEHARAQAQRCDQELAQGIRRGALHGVPVAIKDVIDTCDFPTEHGSPIFSGNQPSHDAECVRQLRAAGAVIFGKTVTAELASLTPGATRNPANLEHTPGGSSSGSAAAVAAKMVPLALGTQTAGSVLRPASYCGIYGFKPTLGLVSRRGVLLQSHTLDTVGVLARSIDDIALALSCMSAHDALDDVAWPGNKSILSRAQGNQPGSFRFAFAKAPAWYSAEAAMQFEIERVVRQLGSACDLVELSQEFERIVEDQALIQFTENGFHYGELYDHHKAALSPGMVQRLEDGLRTSAREYQRAVLARAGYACVIAKIFERYDAIISPASPGPAPSGLGATGSPVFNGYWTFLGVPAISLPLLSTGGLPMGLQLSGAFGADARLLQAAWQLEGILRTQ